MLPDADLATLLRQRGALTVDGAEADLGRSRLLDSRNRLD
jgi:hypothetical protein